MHPEERGESRDRHWTHRLGRNVQLLHHVLGRLRQGRKMIIDQLNRS